MQRRRWPIYSEPQQGKALVLSEVTHGCASLDHHSASGSVQVLPGGAGGADVGTRRLCEAESGSVASSELWVSVLPDAVLGWWRELKSVGVTFIHV